MILTKMIINTATGEIENIPLTDEEIAAHQAAAQKAAEEAALNFIEPTTSQHQPLAEG